MIEAQTRPGPGNKALTLQAAYFILSGIWPVVHIKSFLAVTGPKHDVWLVKTFGVLITAVGLAMAFALARNKATTETAVLGASTAAALAAADAYYVARGRISPVYLIDALVEASFFVYWLLRARGLAAGRHVASPRSDSSFVGALPRPASPPAYPS